jgi:hypothetical protein
MHACMQVATGGTAGLKGPNHSLYTPPERVPVLTDAGAVHYQAEIERLVHRNRWVVLACWWGDLCSW